MFSFYSASRGHPGHLGEHTAGAADWTRRLQAQRHLRVGTNRQRQDSCIRHTCHTGELPHMYSMFLQAFKVYSCYSLCVTEEGCSQIK